MENTVGVALTKCFYCLEGDKILINRVLLPNSADKVKRCHGKVIDMDPCPKCKDWMEKGIILIGIVDALSDKNWNKPPERPRYAGHSDSDNWIPDPYRSGGFAVIKEEAALRLFPDEFHTFMLRKRFMFIEHEAAIMLGIWEKKEATNEDKA